MALISVMPGLVPGIHAFIHGMRTEGVDGRDKRHRDGASRLLPGHEKERMSDKSKDIPGERIAKVMARAGLASRREAEAWIAAGRVAVNGAAISSPALNVTAADRITVDGEPLRARERTRLFLYNKLRGLVTSHSDPQGRPTIFRALPKNMPRLISVGRLDLNTEGLLLLTNDGGLARVLELPATGWLRRYRVRAFGRVTQEALDRLRNGVTIDGVRYGEIEATLDREQGSNVWLTFAIREGKNREVRKVLESLGLKVNRLIRVSYGPFQLGELADGAVEEVKTAVAARATGAACRRSRLRFRRADCRAGGAAPVILRRERARRATGKHATSWPLSRPPLARSESDRDDGKKQRRATVAAAGRGRNGRGRNNARRRRPVALARRSPGRKAHGLRPTADRLRESLFNILAHAYGDPVSGARVLDLFAGTGALGIEAISRGAAYTLFVDDGVEARALLRNNVEALGLGGVTRIFRRDATRLGPAHPVEPFSLAFLDPPYGRGLAEKALASARDGGWLTPEALIVVEEAADAGFTAPDGFTELERRHYDDTQLIFLRAPS